MAKEKLSAIREATNKVLEPSGWRSLEWDFVQEVLTASHPEHGRLPVAMLSDGIRNVIGLVGDLAHRMTRINPHLGARAIKETPGLVLIDEVDMHLHPEWQQQIVKTLLEAFPCIQFIITTHSPQVLTTLPRENIRILEGDCQGFQATIPTYSPLAHTSGDALARIMGTPPIPGLELIEMVRSFEAMVREGGEDSEQAQSLRRSLDESGYQFHPSDLETWRFLAMRNKGRS